MNGSLPASKQNTDEILVVTGASAEAEGSTRTTDSLEKTEDNDDGCKPCYLYVFGGIAIGIIVVLVVMYRVTASKED